MLLCRIWNSPYNISFFAKISITMKIYPDKDTVFPNPAIPSLCYIRNVVKNPRIIIGRPRWNCTWRNNSRFPRFCTMPVWFQRTRCGTRQRFRGQGRNGCPGDERSPWTWKVHLILSLNKTKTAIGRRIYRLQFYLLMIIPEIFLEEGKNATHIFSKESTFLIWIAKNLDIS